MLKIALLGSVACQTTPQPSLVASPVLFEVGSSNDPVLQMALANRKTTQSVVVDFTNSTAYPVTAGLVTTTQLFTTGKTASAALVDYVTFTSAKAGDPEALANGLGLIIGVNAFVLPAMLAGESVSITVETTAGSSLYVMSRLAESDDDFIGATLSISSGRTSGAITIDSYDVNGGKRSSVVSTSKSSGTVTLNNVGSNCGALNLMTTTTNLVDETFSSGANDPSWPQNIGWAGDFNGDWQTDGSTARMSFSNIPPPFITGFVKYVDVCPTTTAKVSVYGDVETLYTSGTSDTSLVVYFLDANDAVLGVTSTLPLKKGNKRRLALYDMVVPANTRRIALAPMAYISSDEASSAFFSRLALDYDPGTKTTTVLASDDFSSFGTSAYGDAQPTGWSEFGGDWYTIGSSQIATLWNSTWGGDQSAPPPIDTGLTKTFALSNVTTTDRLDADIFAAVTFTDPTSFARLRLVYSDGSYVESDRMQGVNYDYLYIHRAAIPAGATSVTFIVNVYLGPSETSSLYVDNAGLRLVR